MKRLVVILTLFALCACLFGCSTPEVGEDVSTNSSFVIVEDGASYYIVYHKDTKVMYALSAGGNNCGSFCLLVNADGTPMIWEGN